MARNDWLSNFPFDYERKVYHGKSVISLDNVIECLSKFLSINIDAATEFFFGKAELAAIDILKKDFQGLLRPATERGAAHVLSYWENYISCPLDKDEHRTGMQQLHEQNYFFLREDILRVINNEVQGGESIFSLASATIGDGQLESTERNTLLLVIAALIKNAEISLEKPSKAAGMIAALTQELGAKVSISTIEKIIKKIPDAVERRST